MWLNLYVCQAVRHKLKNGLKTQKMHFLPVIELMSDSLPAIKIEPHQCPLHQSILLIQKNIENWRFWKTQFFESAILIFFFKKKKKLLQFNEKTKGFHMRYHLFLQHGWFLQNLGKYFIRTNMHTPVKFGLSEKKLKKHWKLPETSRNLGGHFGWDFFLWT